MTASEESSTDPEAVQPTNFSYNTDQYFFEVFRAPDAIPMDNEMFKLTVFYTEPDTGMRREYTVERRIGDILGAHEHNIRAAETIHALSLLIADRITSAEARQILSQPSTPECIPLLEEYGDLIQRYLRLSRR